MSEETIKYGVNGEQKYLPTNDFDSILSWSKIELGILNGSEYVAYDYFKGLADGDSKEYLLVLPSNKDIMLRGIVISTEAECELRMFIDPTLDDNGTDISNQIISRNRKKNVTSSVKFYKDPVYTNEGELLRVRYISGTGSVTYFVGKLADMMLFNGGVLMFQILNKSGGTMNRATVEVSYREW